MTDRRTRDQLRLSNTKLRAAIRKFVATQEHLFAVWGRDDFYLPPDWKEAYDAMKELMGEQAPEGK